MTSSTDSEAPLPTLTFGPNDRRAIVTAAGARQEGNGTFRKRARLVAVRIDQPFNVQTDQGVVSGEPGDWLATNHPDDDPGSDVWVVSAERMAATYEPSSPPATATEPGYPPAEHFWSDVRTFTGEQLAQAIVAIQGRSKPISEYTSYDLASAIIRQLVDPSAGG